MQSENNINSFERSLTKQGKKIYDMKSHTLLTKIRPTALFLLVTMWQWAQNSSAQEEKNLFDESKTEATFYVAPAGNDANDGSFGAPFRTLEKAKKAVRAVNNDMSKDIAVCLREGTYQLTSTLTLGAEDGGSNGHYVRYVNYPNEHPLITGGQPINGWTLYDQKNNIWCAKNVELRFRQLYVNGKKAVRACFPNVNEDGDHDFVRLTKVDTFGRAFDVASQYVADWKNFDKVEMHLMIAWSDNVLRLESKQEKGNITKLIPRDPERTRLFRRKYPMLGVAFWSNPPKQQVFYLENAYEFIDAPGEWYLDESDNTLYYKAHNGEDMNTAVVVAPYLNTLVSIEGKDTDSKVGYLAFEGLTFAHSTFMRPSYEGFLDLQAGMYNIEVIEENGLLGSNKFLLWRPEAGFRVENAHHINISKNVFTQMAATGLDFVSGTNDDKIEGNVFRDLGGSGIMIGKFSQDSLTEIHEAYNPTNKNEICTRDTIKNNYIHNVTTEIQGAVGIGAGYPRDLLIEHNELSYMNYSGISVGYGWTTKPTAMNHNRINLNRIHHVSRLLSDCGPIYTLSNQGYEGEIQYNYITDISASKYADYWVLPIYLDEGTSGFNVSHNVYNNAPGGVSCNACGSNIREDNDGQSATVKEYAGIEKDYKYILYIEDIPLPDFSETVPQSPYKEHCLPGILQAEDYDYGGQLISFKDKDFVNEGSAYREDGVDIVALGGDDAPEGYAIGYTNTGEWLEYTLTVKETAAYRFKAKVSSGLEHSGFRLFLDGTAISDTMEIPQGEDWDTYTTIEGETSALTEGEHVLRLTITGSYANIDWLEFVGKDGSFTKAEQITATKSEQGYSVYTTSGVCVCQLPVGENSRNIMDSLRQKGLPAGIYFIKQANGTFSKQILTK